MQEGKLDRALETLHYANILRIEAEKDDISSPGEEAILSYLLALGYKKKGDNENAELFFQKGYKIRKNYRQCFLGVMIFELTEQDAEILDSIEESVRN